MIWRSGISKPPTSMRSTLNCPAMTATASATFGVADHRRVGGVFSHQRQHRHQVRFTGAVVADDQHAGW